MTPPPDPRTLACNLLEALPDAMCLFWAESGELFPNRAWRAQFGNTTRLEELAALGIETGTLLDMIDAGFSEHEETSIGLDAGGLRHLRAFKVDPAQRLFAFLIRDESEIRRIEQMRKDFIANVSHELRTPLTAVRGYVETLMDPKFLTLEHVHQFLPVIFEHTERLHNLVLDLLSLSRLESPDTRIELSHLTLAEELEDAVEATAPLAKLKNIHVELNAPDDSVKVLANSEHMERILVNLLDNAIKYSSPNGRVTIWTEAEGDRVWTHVKDEGAGITNEELPRVFERFYRTKGALIGRARGSGLGLAIVKHIVQQLDGEIRVSSAVGEGSDFYFSLRRAEN